MSKYVQLEIPFDFEEFKDIQGYESEYQVSNQGRVFSIKRGKMLKPSKNTKGYLFVDLCKDGKTKHYLVHRLVAQAFLENKLQLPQINHISEDKTDNRVCNLEYCTAKYNMNYGTRTERAISKMLAHPNTCIKQPKPILQFTRNNEFVKEYPSLMEAERQTGINHRNICQCCRGNKSYSHVGNYIWRYKDIS